MTNSQQMFLFAAEEMSFTKASTRAYVTQQCLSDHIRRLEESLNTRLFDRYPRLKLTRAGEIYYRSLLEIRQIEKHTLEMIADDSESVHGSIRLGIQTNRAQFLFPRVYPAYHQLYPNVRIQLIDGHTEEFLDMLEQGRIDLMLGHDPLPRRNLSRETLFEEPIYLLATEAYLKRYLSGWDGGRTPIETDALSAMPLACTTYQCALMEHVDRFLRASGVTVQYVCAAGDYLTLLKLCRENAVAFFCPESYLLQSEFAQSRMPDQENRVLAMPIRHMESTIRVEVICRAGHAIPRYMEAFRELLIAEYRDRFEEFRAAAKDPMGKG